MSVLARLAFWVPAETTAGFEEEYQRHLVPLLKEWGLETVVPDDRPAIKGVCRRVFAMESAAEVVRVAKRLERHTQWGAALEGLHQRLGLGGEGLPYSLELYRAPAGPGQVFEVGLGFRQGLWQNYGILDGMPSCISALMQDRQGDLWMGTGWYKAGREWGACRYDGARLHRFTSADGLVNDQVRTVVEDRGGRLWFGTFGGLSCYDGKEFVSYTKADGMADNRAFSLLEDSNGHLWAGGWDGLSRWDGERFWGYGVDDDLVLSESFGSGQAITGVSSILEDSKGHLWIGGLSGLSRWDGERFCTYTIEDGLSNSNWVRCLLEDHQGDIWVGTGYWGSGPDQAEQRGGLSRWDGSSFYSFSAEDGLSSAMIRCLAADNQGQVWAGTWGGGVSRWDGSRFCAHTTEDGLANNRVFSMMADCHGYFWLGTQGGGLSRYDQPQLNLYTTANGLPSNGITALALGQDRQLWVGTWDGLACFEGGKFVAVSALAGKMVQAVVPGRRHLWLGTYGDGLLHWDGKVVGEVRQASDQSFGEVRDVVEDSRGDLWVGSNWGVSRFDGAEWVNFSTDEGLPNKEVRRMLEDSRGRLWIATDGGVGCYDGQSLSSYTSDDGLVHDNVMAILEDRQGQLWFATDGGGVSCFDGEGFTNFTATDGLCHDQINDILEDSQGHLWFATNGGVGRYDGRVFQRLSRNDGLAHDAVLQLLEGEVGDFWIATEAGLTRYCPQAVAPCVGLKTVIADKRYDPDERLHLPARQQVVLFEFSGSSWTTPAQRLAYVYRLLGHEVDWKAAYRGRVEYHGLPEGNYTFEVRAVDRDLNYSPVAQVEVVIEPDLRLAGLSQALSATGLPTEFVGTSKALRTVQNQLVQVAPTDMTVIILGETGTGKGLAARALHALSGRSGPLLQVNCGALPHGLIESELFGHEKGAFTGAHSRKLGKVELAEGGTLFLDEIGDLAAEAQVKLLQVLEERTYERVGGTRTLRADVRIVAATNRDLEQKVEAKEFRQDLYFRLQGFTVRLPPLRQRREDIEQLAHYFLEKRTAHLDRPVRRIDAAAMAQLRSYDWPGNVRELENAINRAVVICTGVELGLEDLELERRMGPDVANEEPLVSLEAMERKHILAALEQCRWVISGAEGAAKVLGLHEATLRHRMRKLGIKRPVA